MIDKEILDAVLPLPTLDELKEQKVEELKDEGFVISNFHSGGVFYTMLMIVLRIKVEVIELLRVVLNNMFVSHAGGAWLDLKMADYSKKRKKAQKTQGFITVRRADMTGEAVKIPKGHVFKSILDINGEELRFFVLEAATLQKGASSVDVLVEAETEGSRYNVPAGQIVRTLTYLGDVTFSNAEDWIVREGSDTEDDESARARTLRSWSELAQRATEDTFIDAAESVPGVLFAQADCNHPRGQGTVDVIVTGTAGEATEGLLAAVREAVDKIAGPYDLYSEVNNVRLWRDLKKIEKTRQAGVSEYTPGKYRHRIIMEPKERSLHIPPLRDKVVQLVIHQELQTLFRPVFVNRSFACMYGKGPIRAAFNVQHDMRVARMKWGDEATVIKIDVRKFFYSIDRSVLKQIIAKRFKKLKKKYPEKYEDFLRFYRLLCKVIDSSPEGERGIPLGNVSSQDFANIYLNELDQFCIRFLGATLYTRYMDDVVVIAPNKEIAREWLAKIKVFLQERLHLETNQKTKIFYVRQGVNAYGFKIKATHLLLRTESKRREKRRIKRMMEKLQEGTITKAAIVQSVNSWLGFARWACAYNLAKKIFAPYRFIKTEGELPYGAISRNRQARRILQQRRGAGKTHKAVA